VTTGFFGWEFVDAVLDFSLANVLGREGHRKKGFEKSSNTYLEYELFRLILCGLKTLARCLAKMLAISESEVAYELLDIRRGG